MTSGNYGPGQPNEPYAQQPPYGQQPGSGGSPAGYGPSGYGDAAAAPGVYALALAAVSAVLGVLSFTALNWYSGKGDSKFSDVRDLVTNAQTKPYAAGMAKVYFGWLAWVLLAAVVVSAVLAALPNFTRCSGSSARCWHSCQS